MIAEPWSRFDPRVNTIVSEADVCKMNWNLYEAQLPGRFDLISKGLNAIRKILAEEPGGAGRGFIASADFANYSPHDLFVKRLVFTLHGPGCVVLVVFALVLSAGAQTTSQVWPEVSVFAKLNDQTRFYFLSTTVKEDKESTEIEVGPNFDFYLKPLATPPNKLRLFRLDESKNRPLMVRVGYRYIYPITGDTPDEHRGVLEATGRLPLGVGILLLDRSRMDFRSIGGETSWRYRNRLTIDDEIEIGRFRTNPYVRAEVYYDSRYGKWSRTTLTAGSTFPVTRRFELESYFQHQNDTGGSSNRELNAVGVVLNIYF